MTAPAEITTLRREAEAAPQKPGAGRLLLSFGAILAALAAGSCCVVPFALFVAGVSGAWITTLTVLAPHQPIFIALAFACLAAGYYKVYRKRRAAGCAEGSYCATPESDRIAKTGLWVATVLIVLALGFRYAAPLFLTSN